ncbi:hypothetical protein ES703_117047 [subsurface metagenome]
MDFNRYIMLAGDGFDLKLDKGVDLLGHQHLLDRFQQLYHQFLGQGVGGADFQYRNLILDSQPLQRLQGVAV